MVTVCYPAIEHADDVELHVNAVVALEVYVAELGVYTESGIARAWSEIRANHANRRWPPLDSLRNRLLDVDRLARPIPTVQGTVSGLRKPSRDEAELLTRSTKPHLRAIGHQARHVTDEMIAEALKEPPAPGSYDGKRFRELCGTLGLTAP